MKIEREGFCYEKGKQGGARITVALNPDGFLTPQVESLLQRSFRFGDKEDTCLKVFLYTDLDTNPGGSMEFPVFPDCEQNALAALKSVVGDPGSTRLFTGLVGPMSKAVIVKQNSRKAAFGDLTDEEIVLTYMGLAYGGLVDFTVQPPKAKSVAYLWQRARGEVLARNGGSSFNPALDFNPALSKLLDQANKPRE